MSMKMKMLCLVELNCSYKSWMWTIKYESYQVTQFMIVVFSRVVVHVHRQKDNFKRSHIWGPWTKFQRWISPGSPRIPLKTMSKTRAPVYVGTHRLQVTETEPISTYPDKKVQVEAWGAWNRWNQGLDYSQVACPHLVAVPFSNGHYL